MIDADSTCDVVLESLRGIESKRQTSRLLKRGIALEHVLGCNKAAIKTAAQALGKNQKLAEALWTSSFHEARLLAVLIADEKTISLEVLKQWANELWSWDLTDQLARYLLPCLNDPHELIAYCLSRQQLFTKRLAYAGIACLVMKERRCSEEQLEGYLEVIQAGATDERHHVRKAVVWALVEIGKYSSAWQEAAIVCASELIESASNEVQDPRSSKNLAWVSRNALKELEQLVSVPERRRLLAGDSKTARKHLNDKDS